MLSFEMLPAKYEALIAGFIFLTSALWFARSDIETEDHWFNGFPAVWNLVIPTLLIVGADKNEVLVVAILLSGLQLTNFKVPHLVRVRKFRKLTLPLTCVYLADLTYLSWNFSDLGGEHINSLQTTILIAFPIYIGLLSIWRTWFSKENMDYHGSNTVRWERIFRLVD